MAFLQQTINQPNHRSIQGIIAATLMGALSGWLSVGLWSLLATVIGNLDATLPVGFALLTGAVIGIVIGFFRTVDDTNWTIVVTSGSIAAILWLIFSAGKPLSVESSHWFWTVLASFLTFIGTAHLTRYGLRDLKLGNFERYSIEILVLRVIRAFGFVFFLSIVIFPFYFMIASSLKPRAELLQNPSYLGFDVTQGFRKLFIGYTEVLFTFDFLRYIGNSTFIAVATVIITLFLSVLGAYAVTRLNFPGREILSRSILLIYMFPAIVLVIPLYSIFTQLGLRNTLPGLLVVYPATTIPVALYMLRSYFQTLPKDLEEAGLIDGLSRIGVIWRITLPLSLPALASVGLYVFMIAWNEFLFAFMFLDNPAIFTLSRGMVGLNSQEVPRQFLMAGAVIVTVPIMALFLWFEKYLTGGLTAGGVKG